RLMRQLVGETAGLDGARRPAIRAALYTQAAATPQAKALVDRLIAARILIGEAEATEGAGATVRVAHQRVIDAWPRAAKLVADNANYYRVAREVTEAEVRWASKGKPADLLLPRGIALAEAEDLVRDFRGELADSLVGYVVLSAHRARRAQRVSIGASVVFGLVAIAAVIGAGSAWRARLDAEAQRQLAVRQTEIAQDKTELANGAFLEANKQREIAEKQSALLSSRVADQYIDNGSIDKALILTLKYAKYNTDSNINESIKDTLLRGVSAFARREITYTQPNLDVYDTGGDILFVDKLNHAIYRVEDSGKLIPISAPEYVTQHIKSIFQIDYQKIAIVSTNLGIHIINTTNGKDEIISPDQLWGNETPYPGCTTNSEIRLLRDRYFIRSNSFACEDKYPEYASLQVFDLKYKKSYQYRANEEPFSIIYASINEKLLIARTTDGEYYSLMLINGNIQVRKIDEKQLEKAEITVGNCNINIGKEPFRALIDALRAKEPQNFICARGKSGFLITSVSSTTSGSERVDTLITAEKKVVDLRDGLFEYKLSSVNALWTAIDPLRDRIAMVIDRYLFVFDKNGMLDFSERLASHPKAGKFAKDGSVLVVEPDDGRITRFTLGDDREDKSWVSEDISDDTFDDKQESYAPLNPGTCSGRNRIGDHNFIINGRKFSAKDFFDEDNKEHIGLKIEDNLVDIEINLDYIKSPFCLQISRDGRKILFKLENQINIYNVDDVIYSKNIRDVDHQTIDMRNLATAFFLDTSDEIITTSFGDNRVMQLFKNTITNQWDNRVLFLMDAPVEYAEPDRSGMNYIIGINPGLNGLQMYFYSTTSLRILKEFGVLGRSSAAYFTENGKIVNNISGGKQIISIPTFENAVALAQTSLALRCRLQRNIDAPQEPCESHLSLYSQ
ncbi:MAG: hypothetical protein GX458_01825, partial [Phyllobacteriaceae bacterium]|nr:hypothetical protein [Phyllobacteriaceae bacterium]